MSEPIQLYETGPYGELTARPNPDGFTVITIPPIEAMLLNKSYSSWSSGSFGS
jgi:hypothetical protein